MNRKQSETNQDKRKQNKKQISSLINHKANKLRKIKNLFCEALISRIAFVQM